MRADEGESLGRDELRSLFVRPADARELIGLEVENPIVDPATGRAAPYLGKNGVGALLGLLLDELGGEPRYDGAHLMGLQAESGMILTLEHGGAVEYCSAPADSLTTAVDEMQAVMARLGEAARSLGLAVLPGAGLPFDRFEDTTWMPKPRGAILREFFARLGDDGRLGPAVMALTTSTQVTLDYLSEIDLAEKVRMQTAASPVVAGLFANSPLADGRLSGLQSRRCQCWLETDPRRCGLLPPALSEAMTIDTYIDWAVTVPMIYYRAADDDYRLANRTFAEILAHGFENGRRPVAGDWPAHLSQLWTDVRVRRTLELRAADGPCYAHIPAVPALWVGLSYDSGSRAAAWELLRHYSASDIRQAIDEVPGRGLRASLGGVPFRELGQELVRLARAGLRARVDAGIEHEKVLAYLDPVEEVLESGCTFADKVIRRWNGDFRRDPARYVTAFRI
jgi:glutamate--cysteine ligase